MEQYHQRYIDDVRREMMSVTDELRTQVADLSSNIGSVQNTLKAVTTQSFAEIVNNLDNSTPEWSKKAYLNTGVDPAEAVDDNLECYNWYRVPRDETVITPDSAAALKSEGHSTFAANEETNEFIPRWDRVNAQIEIGDSEASRWDLVYPLMNNPISPGTTFYLQFEAMLRTSSPAPNNLQISAGFYDSTSGQEKYIEGGAFTITGAIFKEDAGIPDGTATVEYQVKAKKDSGEETLSDILTFTTAPDVFTQNHHPRISFRGAPGFIEFEIYRKKGGVTVLQYVVRNSIESSYFDVGNPPIKTVADFPGTVGTPPKAFARTVTFVPGAIGGAGFVRHSLTITVPTTYNKSLTGANQQYLRISLTNPTTDARQILLRRFGLSQGEGGWSRSANDKLPNAHSVPSSAPVSSPSGGSGQPVDPPPPPGSGYCVLLDSLINIVDKKKKRSKITLAEAKERLKRGEILFGETGGAVTGKLLDIKIGHAATIIHIETANGLKLSGTREHPLISDILNFNGTPLADLKGRKVLTYRNRRVSASEIISYREEYGDFTVGIPVMEGVHICILNGFLSHNRKSEYEYDYYLV